MYQFMDNGPDAFCPGCTHFTNNVADLGTLPDTGVTFVTVSNMPLDQIEQYKARMGWTVPFVSSRGNGFADDSGAGNLFRLTVFLRDGDDVYLTYSTTARGVDRLLFSNNILDLTPYGRQEDWEDSPPGLAPAPHIRVGRRSTARLATRTVVLFAPQYSFVPGFMSNLCRVCHLVLRSRFRRSNRVERPVNPIPNLYIDAMGLGCTGTRSDFSEVEQGAEHGFVLTGLDLAPGPGLVIGVRLNPV